MRRLAFAVAAFWAVLGAILAAGWTDLEPSEQAALAAILESRAGFVILLAVTALAGSALLVRFLFGSYAGPLKRLAEEAQLLLSGNPAHRLKVEGADELRPIAAAINGLADQRKSLQQDVDARIRAAQATLEEEKNRLAALMSEFTQSVVVCNVEGRILLYNARAKQLVGRPAGASLALGGFVGLGRSIFGIIERSLVSHALDQIREKLAQKMPNPVVGFMTTMSAGQLVRVQMAPVATGDHLTGFVLTLENITRTVELGNRRDDLLQSLTEGARASLGSIRAAVESMIAFPDLPPARRGRFIAVIDEEARRLSERLDRTVAEFADLLKTQWPLEEMRGTDFVTAARRRIEAKLKVPVLTPEIEPNLWLRLDSYSVLQAVAYLATRVKTEFGVDALELRLLPGKRLASIDLAWTGAPDPDALAAWEADPMTAGGEASPLTVLDVVDRHGGEIWHKREGLRAYFRLLLPTAAPPEHADLPVPAGSRPEFYDFDLFHHRESAVADAPLADLAYTVFDTETTGLNPSGGDEIISIGAVRIVNGRLLQHEVFDQLVDPRRPVPPESVAIHGIDPALLAGQPTIDAVLPQFQRFCEDTVLVGHNAAFDMRFVEIKERQVGVRLANPLLDTLLLSAVLHPTQESHSLEAIAARLGVDVIGRHTALGDAIVTGEVFLKMIPLLAERGIVTLRDAIEAARRTFYARIEY